MLKIPPHLNTELEAHSHIGITGPLHFAGFIDNGFEGDLVFEVRSDELSNMALEHEMPISRLNVFRTELPDKIYGTSIGSNYQGQVGPKPAKYFQEFDFTLAARNYKKLDRLVLVEDANTLNRHRKSDESFEFIDSDEAEALCNDARKGFFHSRYDCEDDTLVLQPIPYVLLFGPDRTVFTYVRATNIKDYGDKRLFKKHSIGAGGHIIRTDGPEYLESCIEREVFSEEVRVRGDYSRPKLVGTLMAYDKEVDTVHFGLVFAAMTTGQIEPNESSIASGRMITFEELEKDLEETLDNPDCDREYETWSRVLIPHLQEIYDRLA